MNLETSVPAGPRGDGRRLLPGVLALSSLLGGCGAAPQTALPDLATLPPDLLGVDLVAPGYPAGPFGGDVGSVLPNLTFQGYYSPTKTTGLASTEMLADVSFDQMRTSGAKYGIINIAAFW